MAFTAAVVFHVAGFDARTIAQYVGIGPAPAGGPPDAAIPTPAPGASDAVPSPAPGWDPYAGSISPTEAPSAPWQDRSNPSQPPTPSLDFTPEPDVDFVFPTADVTSDVGGGMVPLPTAVPATATADSAYPPPGTGSDGVVPVPPGYPSP
jgi:hypothetical protein